jgi:hypothetical protein
MEAKARVYCTNSECSKKHICRRYVSRALPEMITRCYAEFWNKQACIKFVPSVANEEQQPAYIKDDEPQQTKGRIQNPRDIELREHLVRMISENFDALFMQEMAFRSGMTYNIPRIAGRVVDLLMPVITRNSTVRKYR